MPTATLPKSRFEAFSDGVFAIIITIMVLELRAPEHATLEALRPLIPKFLSYLLSFLYVGIYWNNHHHLIHAAKHVTGMALWANLHLLFWLTLLPFTTDWMGETHFAPTPTAIYGANLLLCGASWQLLIRCLLKTHPKDSPIHQALSRGTKERFSVISYATGIAIAAVGGQTTESPWPGITAAVIYGAVAAMWFIPDRRIEKAVATE